jgi:hypothetical protein
VRATEETTTTIYVAHICLDDGVLMMLALRPRVENKILRKLTMKRIAVGVVLPTTDSCVTNWWGWAPRTVPSSSLGWFQRWVLSAASWPVSVRSQSAPSRGCDVEFGTAWTSRGCLGRVILSVLESVRSVPPDRYRSWYYPSLKSAVGSHVPHFDLSTCLI